MAAIASSASVSGGSLSPLSWASFRSADLSQDQARHGDIAFQGHDVELADDGLVLGELDNVVARS